MKNNTKTDLTSVLLIVNACLIVGAFILVLVSVTSDDEPENKTSEIIVQHTSPPPKWLAITIGKATYSCKHLKY